MDATREPLKTTNIMKPNPKITKKVSESIADLRSTLIQSTVQMCKRASARQNDIGAFKLNKPVAIASFCSVNGRVLTESMLADRVYYWYGDNYYIIGGADDKDAASDSKSLSIDSLVAVYEAVKKTVSKL